MAWGINVGGFAMFGMLVLVLAHVMVEEDVRTATSAPSYTNGESDADELRNAA